MTASGSEIPSLMSGMATVPPAITSSDGTVVAEQTERLRHGSRQQVGKDGHAGVSSAAGRPARSADQPRLEGPQALVDERPGQSLDEPAVEPRQRAVDGGPALVRDRRPVIRHLSQPEGRVTADRAERARDGPLEPAGARRVRVHQPDDGRVRPDDPRQPQGDPAAVLVVADLLDLAQPGMTSRSAFGSQIAAKTASRGASRVRWPRMSMAS